MEDVKEDVVEDVEEDVVEDMEEDVVEDVEEDEVEDVEEDEVEDHEECSNHWAMQCQPYHVFKIVILAKVSSNFHHQNLFRDGATVACHIFTYFA